MMLGDTRADEETNYELTDREVPVYDSESYRADRLTSSDNENIEDSSKETSLAYLFEVIRKTFRNDACVSSAMHLIERFQKEELAAKEDDPYYWEIQPFIWHSWVVISCFVLSSVLDQYKEKDFAETGNTAVSSCKDIIKNILSQNEPTPSGIHSDDLIQYGRGFASNERPLLSLVTLYACAFTHKMAARGNSSVDGVQKCSWLITFAFEKLSEDKKTFLVTVNHLIPLLEKDLTKFIRSVRSSCHKFRTENEAWCIMRMGLCHASYGDDKGYAGLCEKAINLIKRKFKKDARSHQVYATCLSNAGAAYVNCGQVDKALELYNRSAEAYDRVRDWENKDEKEKALVILKHNKSNVSVQEKPNTHATLEETAL